MEIQIELLKQLAVKIREEDKDKNAVISSLQSANILDKNGDFSEHYPNLDKYFEYEKNNK